MKVLCFIPLLFLSACSTAPKLTLKPQQSPSTIDNAAVRYPEAIRAYHVGRYTDPNDDLVMHERHVFYRIEETARWNFHPGPANDGSIALSRPSFDAAFAPVPVNDAILAEVNSQRLATAQIMAEKKMLTVVLQQLQKTLLDASKTSLATDNLRTAMDNLKKRLESLEAAVRAQSPVSSTNEPARSLSP